jgi:hypothetical protein
VGDAQRFMAAQVFTVAAAASWPEERVLFMPLAGLAQYQHCLPKHVFLEPFMNYWDLILAFVSGADTVRSQYPSGRET